MITGLKTNHAKWTLAPPKPAESTVFNIAVLKEDQEASMANPLTMIMWISTVSATHD